MQLFFSLQPGHLKLSGYGLLSTQGVQNRSQNCWVVSQSYVMPISLPGGGAKKVGGPEGVKLFDILLPSFFTPTFRGRLPRIDNERKDQQRINDEPILITDNATDG